MRLTRIAATSTSLSISERNFELIGKAVKRLAQVDPACAKALQADDEIDLLPGPREVNLRELLMAGMRKQR